MKLTGGGMQNAIGQVLTAPALDSHNTFDAPSAVAPAAFTGFELKGDELVLTLPARSVVEMTLND